MHYIQNNGIPKIINIALSIGGTGVHIFFLCSGFGLYLSYLIHPITYKEFIRKRFMKIYIPYIIVIAISALVPYMYDGNRVSAFLSHVFLYKMFILKYEESFGPFWYISTLFQFYFLFIPLIHLKEWINNKKKFIYYCIFISMLWWIITALLGIAEQRIWGSFFLQYLWEFALGMVIAENLYEKNTIKIKTVYLALTVCLGIGIAGTLKIIGGVFVAFNDLFACFGYGALALLFYKSSLKILHTCIYNISKISYEIYLIHIFIFVSLIQLGWNRYITAIIAFPMCYFVAKIMNKMNHVFLSRY